MKLTFVEALDFTEVVYDYFGSDAEFATFQETLLANPERGNLILGCGGLRKTRWRMRDGVKAPAAACESSISMCRRQNAFCFWMSTTKTKLMIY
jgi:hypothetical protein